MFEEYAAVAGPADQFTTDQTNHGLPRFGTALPTDLSTVKLKHLAVFLGQPYKSGQVKDWTEHNHTL